MKNGESRAFPALHEDESGKKIAHGEFGLTKREYFASMAMQGLLASCTGDDFPTVSAIANQAVKHADALLAKLAESEAQNA